MPVVTRDVGSNATVTRDRPIAAGSIETDSLVLPIGVVMNGNASQVHPNAVDLTATDSPGLPSVADRKDVASTARDMIEAASPVPVAGNWPTGVSMSLVMAKARTVRGSATDIETIRT